MYNTTKDFLIGAQLPQQTRTYKPVSHQQLIDLTLESCLQAGFNVERETYSATKDGLIANARYSISNVNDSDMKLEIGWQNSYNKSKSLKFAIGAHVIVCSNGMVHGDMGNFKKKHMGDVQEFTPSRIMEYIKSSGEVFSTMQKEKETMKTIELSSRTRAELIGRMFIEEEFLQMTQLGIISREIETPTHSYGAPNSMWELYNYTTFSMKGLHPSLWLEQHMEAHSWFVGEMGMLTRSTSIVVPDVPAFETRNFEIEMNGVEQV